MQTKKGTVISAKSDKTAVVIVHSYKMHPILKKNYRVSKKFHAHDEKNECKEGDEVVISEIKPISKKKCWKIDKIITKK
jgi:small subunit ribosomal protein S17